MLPDRSIPFHPSTIRAVPARFTSCGRNFSSVLYSARAASNSKCFLSVRATPSRARNVRRRDLHRGRKKFIADTQPAYIVELVKDLGERVAAGGRATTAVAQKRGLAPPIQRAMLAGAAFSASSSTAAAAAIAIRHGPIRETRAQLAGGAKGDGPRPNAPRPVAAVSSA